MKKFNYLGYMLTEKNKNKGHISYEWQRLTEEWEEYGEWPGADWKATGKEEL